MAGGKWSRWGRGSCEGWSLNLGGLIHFSIVRKIDGQGKTSHYEATSHARKIDNFPTALAAKKTIEADLELDMKRVPHDWTVYQREKAARSKD
jgi:hypothetical protein